MGLELNLAFTADLPVPVDAPVNKLPNVQYPIVDFATCVKPQYPLEAQRAEQQGVVQLALLIDIDGKVTHAGIYHSSGNAQLDEAAEVALAHCQYRPGQVNGRKRKMWANVIYIWTLDPGPTVSERYRALAEKGDRQAQYSMVLLRQPWNCQTGCEGANHTMQDASARVRWLEASAAQDYWPALSALALVRLKEKGGGSVALDLMRRAAAVNDPFALDFLHFCESDSTDAAEQ